MTKKTLVNADTDGAKKNVSDLQVWGNGDAFKLICKASSQKEGWMKSTKAMDVSGGCLVQVTTHQRNHDGTNAVAEALTYVPGAVIKETIDPEGNVINREIHHEAHSYLKLSMRLLGFTAVVAIAAAILRDFL